MVLGKNKNKILEVLLLILLVGCGVEAGNPDSDEDPSVSPDGPTEVSLTQSLSSSESVEIEIERVIKIVFPPVGYGQGSLTITVKNENNFAATEAGTPIGPMYEIDVFESEGASAQATPPYRVTLRVDEGLVSNPDALVILFRIDGELYYIANENLDIQSENGQYLVSFVIAESDADFTLFELSGSNNPDDTEVLTVSSEVANIDFASLPSVRQHIPFNLTVRAENFNSELVNGLVPLRVRAVDPSSKSVINELQGVTSLSSSNGVFEFTNIAFTSSVDFQLEIYSSDPAFEIVNGSQFSPTISPTARALFAPADINDHISLAGTPASSPIAAVANNGQRVIAYLGNDGSDDRLLVSEYTGGTWQHDNNVATDAKSPVGADINSHKLEMTSSGQVVSGFVATNGGVARIYIAERISGTWTYPSAIGDAVSTHGGSHGIIDDTSLRVAQRDNGQAAVAWTQTYNSYRALFLSEKVNGTWTHNATPLLSESGAMAHLDLDSMGYDSAGNLHISWRQTDSGSPATRSYLSTRNGSTWSNLTSATPFSHLDTSSGSSRLSFNDNGQGVIVYEQGHDILARMVVYRGEFENNTWTMPTKDQYFSFATHDAFLPNVAISDNGDVTIGYYYSSNDAYYVSERINGVWLDPISDAQDFFTSSSTPWTPSVARSNYGRSMIWNATGGQGSAIFSARNLGSWEFPSNNTDSVTIHPNTNYPTQPGEEAAHVDMDSYGNYLEVFIQDSGAGAGVDEYRLYIREFR